MNSDTISKLNQINTDFYDKIAPYFDSSRQIYWNGWDKLWDFIIENKMPIKSIMDIGCGNGRFYKYLQEKIEALCHSGHKIVENSILENKFEYSGIDNNDYLLKKAKEYQNDRVQFSKQDIVGYMHAYPLHEGIYPYDLIVLFGVMHHIPGFENRLNILKNLKENLSDNGIICISLWKFMDDEREKKKVSLSCKGGSLRPPLDEDGTSSLRIHSDDLEKNDFILSWSRGEKSYRYCHYVSDDEEKELVEKSGLKVIKEFYADGKSEKMNKYLILSI